MGEETEHVAALAKLIEAAHLHLHQFSDSRIAILFVHDISTNSFWYVAIFPFSFFSSLACRWAEAPHPQLPSTTTPLRSPS